MTGAVSPVLLQDTQDPFIAATRAQKRAADPMRSVWVNASAGTGKTKVLIERVLRLLLPCADGHAGSEPHRILCLTYTRAAAGEMAERLVHVVGQWAIMNDADLTKALADLIDAPPTARHMTVARGLFTKLVDGPDQIRMMTIHSFCQSILSRFPLEAGVQPHFTLITEDEQKELLDQARVLSRAALSATGDGKAYYDHIAAELSDDQFDELIEHCLSERRQFTVAFDGVAPSALIGTYQTIFGIGAGDTVEGWVQDVTTFINRAGSDVRTLAHGLGTGTTKTDQKWADALGAWMAMDADVSVLDRFDVLARVFLKPDGTLYDAARQGVRKTDSILAECHVRLGGQIEELFQKKSKLDLTRANIALFTVVSDILQTYQRLKLTRGVLDFDDLIAATSRLLGAQDKAGVSVLPWVMYKLDGGIDHILVDEAQDTNPEQWRIIQALAQNILTPDPDRPRTLLVVGDQKQSIYRFQGAEPETFDIVRQEWSPSQTVASQKTLDRIPMVTSFRSGAAVLHMVDRVFETDVATRALRLEVPPVHVVSRMGQASRVELWPMITKNTDDMADPIPWAIPRVPCGVDDPRADLARAIAKKIRGWLDDKTLLPARGRPINPGDILILVRTRAPFMGLLRAALRSYDIPVDGTDRAPITHPLVVRDALSALRFVSAPDDDLNLACLLKSPFIDLTDDDLIELLPMRTGSVWDAVQTNPKYADVVVYLKSLLDAPYKTQPFSFLTHVLDVACPVQPASSGRLALYARFGDEARRLTDDLLSNARASQERGVSSIQFLAQLDLMPPDIQGQGIGGGNAVRIMTVHGSKGLQAPIVILPDTLVSDRKHHRHHLFWPDDTGLGVPLWTPRATDKTDQLKQVQDNVRQADLAEDQRLLYVALTRAEDWLIVAGATTAGKTAESSWYHAVSSAFETVRGQPEYKIESSEQGDVFVFETMQTAPPDRATFIPVEQVAVLPAPIDLEMLSPLPAHGPQFGVTPIERASPAFDIASPLSVVQDPARFLRGNLIHKLLQILPSLPESTWEQAARAFLETRYDVGTENASDLLYREVHTILTHPNFAPLFGPGSRAEVPVAAHLDDGRVVQGKIDRLWVTDDTVWIVDYKTNRPPPKAIEDVPQIYREQLNTYHAILRGIYPTHAIRMFLLWTDGPYMMEINV
jgi:ATP-dependent helicase/nuclease subunit A